MKKTLICLLSALLIFSCTACGQKDPVFSLISKMETASLQESIVDFSNQIDSLTNKTIEDFNIEQYTKDEESETFTAYHVSKNIFGCADSTISIMFNRNDRQDFCSLSLYIPGSLSSDEIDAIKSTLSAAFEYDGITYHIDENMVLLFLESGGTCEFHFTALPRD